MSYNNLCKQYNKIDTNHLQHLPLVAKQLSWPVDDKNAQLPYSWGNNNILLSWYNEQEPVLYDISKIIL